MSVLRMVGGDEEDRTPDLRIANARTAYNTPVHDGTSVYTSLYAGKSVSLRTYAERIVTVADGKIVGEHVRSFERDRTFFDPWHYLAVLERKPGALRNGAPFKDWALPPTLQEMRHPLCAKAGGDRQFVTILATIAEVDGGVAS